MNGQAFPHLRNTNTGNSSDEAEAFALLVAQQCLFFLLSLRGYAFAVTVIVVAVTELVGKV